MGENGKEKRERKERKKKQAIKIPRTYHNDGRVESPQGG
jgi:hypothetical protein